MHLLCIVTNRTELFWYYYPYMNSNESSNSKKRPGGIDLAWSSIKSSVVLHFIVSALGTLEGLGKSRVDSFLVLFRDPKLMTLSAVGGALIAAFNTRRKTKDPLDSGDTGKQDEPGALTKAGPGTAGAVRHSLFVERVSSAAQEGELGR